MLLLHTTFNLSFFVFPVLDTGFGHVYVLGVFAVAAIVVTGLSGLEGLRRKSWNAIFRHLDFLLGHDRHRVECEDEKVGKEMD